MARILAIFLVLLNHLPAYRLYMSGSGAMEPFYLATSIVTRINVPLFAMISGILLLGREEDVKTLLKKRVLRFLVVILVFSAILYLTLGLKEGAPMDVWLFLQGLAKGDLKHFESYWFLYAYLGFLLSLPFLRPAAQAMKKDTFLLLMGVHIICLTLLPIANYLLGTTGKIVLSHSLCLSVYNATLLFYPLIGYWIDRNVDVTKIKRKQWYMLAILCILGTTLSGFFTWLQGTSNHYTQDFLNLFNFINVITIYLAFKRLFSSKFQTSHPKVSKIVTTIGPLTFGVYLLDPALRVILYPSLRTALLPMLDNYWFSITWCIFSFMTLGLLTYLLRKLKPVRKLI